jgi:hypothetical protein
MVRIPQERTGPKREGFVLLGCRPQRDQVYCRRSPPLASPRPPNRLWLLHLPFSRSFPILFTVATSSLPRPRGREAMVPTRLAAKCKATGRTPSPFGGGGELLLGVPPRASASASAASPSTWGYNALGSARPPTASAPNHHARGGHWGREGAKRSRLSHDVRTTHRHTRHQRAWCCSRDYFGRRSRIPPVRSPCSLGGERRAEFLIGLGLEVIGVCQRAGTPRPQSLRSCHAQLATHSCEGTAAKACPQPAIPPSPQRKTGPLPSRQMLPPWRPRPYY